MVMDNIFLNKLLGYCLLGSRNAFMYYAKTRQDLIIVAALYDLNMLDKAMYAINGFNLPFSLRAQIKLELWRDRRNSSKNLCFLEF